MGRWSGDAAQPESQGVLSRLVGASAPPIVLFLTLHVVLFVANHRRSLHRSRPPRNLANLALYQPSLLAALGKFPVKPLKALLLDVQPAREGVEAFERSALKAVLKLAFPSRLSPTPATGALDLAARRAPPNRGVPRVPRPMLELAYRQCQSADARSCPVSMPETVVGLRPASRANLAWVHIRKRRMFSTRL